MSVLHLSEEEWDQYKATARGRLASIVIPLDISTGIAKELLSRIDAFFSEIRVDLGELEGQKEKISSLIEEWERTKIAGGNDMVRKKTASEALQKYPLSETETVNLYDVYRQIAERKSYLAGIIDALNGKHSRLITVGGLLKMEKELMPYASLN